MIEDYIKAAAAAAASHAPKRVRTTESKAKKDGRKVLQITQPEHQKIKQTNTHKNTKKDRTNRASNNHEDRFPVQK